ncbi:hypothetical protein ABW19_dt0204005 [Dactylella cylindrospora]|nr:hypothetical protein ABW19_dt0204005 [Dactylella cylindrospora]
MHPHSSSLVLHILWIPLLLLFDFSASLVHSPKSVTMCDAASAINPPSFVDSEKAILLQNGDNKENLNPDELEAERATDGGCPTFVELTIPADVNTDVTIPFVTGSGFPDSSAPRVLMTINGEYCGDSGILMDTGSTAITIGKGTWVNDLAGNWSEAVKYPAGYIVTSTNVTIGLTSTNVQGFKFTKLSYQPSPYNAYDWAAPNVSISINNGTYLPGTILTDTGVTQMYLSSPDVPANTTANSYTIDIAVPDSSAAVLGYRVTAFTNGTSPESSVEGTAPMFVGATNTKGTVSGPGSGVYERVFVNTGSRFWNGFATAFDAEGGYWGVKKVE